MGKPQQSLTHFNLLKRLGITTDAGLKRVTEPFPKNQWKLFTDTSKNVQIKVRQFHKSLDI